MNQEMDEFAQPPEVLGDVVRGLEREGGILAKQVRSKAYGPEGSTGDLKIVCKLYLRSILIQLIHFGGQERPETNSQP